MRNRGQIQFLGLIIAGTFTLLASIGGAWFTGSASAQREISKVNTKVELVSQKEELHYKELKEDLNEIKRDLKKLLEYNLAKKI